MAIPDFAISAPTPVEVVKPRGLVKSARSVLNLVPDFDVENSDAVNNRAFMGIIALIFGIGLLVLLGINTALTSGAFTMENLKLHLASVNDQRDALLNQVSHYSSPDQLARNAIKLGMAPQGSINFLTLSGPKKP